MILGAVALIVVFFAGFLTCAVLTAGKVAEAEADASLARHEAEQLRRHVQR